MKKRGEFSTEVLNQETPSTLRCSMTDNPLRNSGDGVYDDGEWVSWEWINQYIEEEVVRDVAKPLSGALRRMIESARAFEEEAGESSDLWGQIGERFAAEQFGLTLHKVPQQQGSDARLGDDYVEVKTITWKKQKSRIQVKRAGNFSQLVLVRVHPHYTLEAVMIARSELQRGKGKLATVSWKTALTADGARWVAQAGTSDSER